MTGQSLVYSGMVRTHKQSREVVLLTDPEQRSTLAAARALGTRFEVHTVGASRGLAGHSRFVHRHHHSTSVDSGARMEYRREIADIVRSVGVSVVVPLTDRASLDLLGFDHEVGCIVAGPSREAYERASDKHGLMRVASQIGICVPMQVVLAKRGELPRWPDGGSVVVKPSHSVVEIHGKHHRMGVCYAQSPVQLEQVLEAFPAEAYPLLVQERVMGDGIGVFLLRRTQKTAMAFAHRRIREKPPSGGVSTYREAIAPPEELLAQSEALLDALAYDGVAMIEFKQDAMSGKTYLMEINARLWGSLQLAVDAGADFPTALVEAALGRSVGRAQPVDGVRTVWELGEVDRALALARHSAATLSLPPDTPTGPTAALRSLFDRRWQDRNEVLRLHDPLPFAAELLRWFNRR